MDGGAGCERRRLLVGGLGMWDMLVWAVRWMMVCLLVR